MTTRTEIKNLLVTDVAGLIASVFPVGTNDCYFARETRTMRSASEIFLRWSNRTVEETESGRLITHSIDIELFRAILEPYEEADFQNDMESAARSIVEAYDGENGRNRLQSSLTSVIDDVACGEQTTIIESEPHALQRIRISQAFSLEVTTWET